METPVVLKPWMVGRNDIVFYGGFENEGDKAIGTDTWRKQWGIAFTNRVEDARIISGPEAFEGGKSLRISYPQGKFGPQFTGIQFPVSFENIEFIRGSLIHYISVLCQVLTWI